MGKHRAVDYPESFGRLTSGDTWGRTGATRVRARRRARAVQEVGRLPLWKRWFKGDWWWLAGFALGIIGGCLGAYATFLWWLTGGMAAFLGGLF